MASNLSVITIYHFGNGPALSLCMVYNDASDFANRWKEFTRKYKGQEEFGDDPMAELAGKVSPTDNRIITWYMDLRDIQALSIS